MSSTIHIKPRVYKDRFNKKTLYLPIIVDDDQNVTLEALVDYALNTGRIAGLKSEAVLGIANGLCDAMYDQLIKGRCVEFGKYFRARPYINGKCNAQGKLAGDNNIVIRLTSGTGFKVSMSDVNVVSDINDNVARVDTIMSSSNGAKKNYALQGDDIMVLGARLCGKKDKKVKTIVQIWTADDKDCVTGDAPVAEINEFSCNGVNLIQFAWPNIEVGKKYALMVVHKRQNGIADISDPGFFETVDYLPVIKPAVRTERRAQN